MGVGGGVAGTVLPEPVNFLRNDATENEEALPDLRGRAAPIIGELPAPLLTELALTDMPTEPPNRLVVLLLLALALPPMVPLVNPSAGTAVGADESTGAEALEVSVVRGGGRDDTGCRSESLRLRLSGFLSCATVSAGGRPRGELLDMERRLWTLARSE